MKKLLSIILAIGAIAPVAQAMNVVYSGVLVSTNGNVSETSKASTQTYTFDVNQAGGDIISLQVAYASATVASFTLTDGSVSTFTATIVSTGGLVGTPASDTIKVATNTAISPTIASAIICVSSNGTTALNGSTFTINATQLTGGHDYTVGASSNATATNIATAINLEVPQVHAYVSPVGGSSVTIITLSSGTAGNAYTIGASTIALLTTGFSGGNDYASFTLNGIPYVNGSSWFSTSFISMTAIAIKNVVNLTRTDVVASTSASDTVTLTAVSSGSWANAFTLTSSTGALTIGGATFSGGQNIGSLVINGVTFAAGSDYAIGGSTKNAAINLAAAINADTRLNTTLVASATVTGNTSWGIVWATASSVGTAYNYTIQSSTHAALRIGPVVSSSTLTGISNGLMVGGTNAAYSLSTPTVITKTAHGLTTGFGIWWSTSTSNTTIAPLVAGTTYYAIKVDANNFSLATTLANALAGTTVTLTSSRTLTSPDTFTVNTQVTTGTPQFILQGSNDGLNWVPITLGFYGASLGTTSFASPYTPASTLWNIGVVVNRYLRLLFNGPTTGGVSFTATVNIKSEK